MEEIAYLSQVRKVFLWVVIPIEAMSWALTPAAERWREITLEKKLNWLNMKQIMGMQGYLNFFFKTSIDPF